MYKIQVVDLKKVYTDVSFVAFMVMMFYVKVFCVVLLCRVVVGYQCFRGPCCLHLQGEVARMGENDIVIGPDWRGAADDGSQ
jgi:hypothetical protein